MNIVLVTGDREWRDDKVIRAAIIRAKAAGATVLIEGEARGADRMAREAAKEVGLPFRPYPALWEQEGRSAGPRRNRRMLVCEQPDTVLAFHDDLDNSKGTGDMVRISVEAEFVQYIYHFSHVRGWSVLKPFGVK